MSTKPCKHCQQPVQVISDPSQPRTCEACKRAATRKRMAKWIARNPDLHRERSKKSQSWRSREAIKQNAKAAVFRAVRDGRLRREKCERCGAEKTDAHHDDYAAPLSVRWLCRAHHLELHRKD